MNTSIKGKFFTSYILSDDEKYPFFYPVNGPSGASVTSMRNGTYPHHSSLFFGCDKVNGGNYWQGGLERGQIVSLKTNIMESGGDRVIIENECIWVRDGGKVPLKDIRRIVISPTPIYWPKNKKEGISLNKGETIDLKYRVLVQEGSHEEANIKEEYIKYKNQ